jgi:hypothetical protein
LDMGDMFYLYVCRGIHALILERIFGVNRYVKNNNLTRLKYVYLVLTRE